MSSVVIGRWQPITTLDIYRLSLFIRLIESGFRPSAIVFNEVGTLTIGDFSDVAYPMPCAPGVQATCNLVQIKRMSNTAVQVWRDNHGPYKVEA